MRLELADLASLEQRRGPRLKGRVLECERMRDHGTGQPHALLLRRRTAEKNPAVGAARRWLCRARLPAAARAALPRCTTAGAPFGNADLHAGTLGLLWLLTSDRFTEQRREEQCRRGNGGEGLGAEARDRKSVV